MKYDPKRAVSCLPAGDYQATIVSAVDGVSKTKKDMITIDFTIYAPGGNTVQLKEYIVIDTLWKLKRISQAIGQEDAFERGEFFADDYVGHNLTLVLKVESSAEYGDQNRISGYKPSAIGANQRATPFEIGQTATPPPSNESDIPF